MKFVYAKCLKCSSDEEEEVREYGKEVGIPEGNIYFDSLSDKNAPRPALNELLSRLRKGDEVYITELARFGMTTVELLELTDVFEAKGVKVISRKENVSHGGTGISWTPMILTKK